MAVPGVSERLHVPAFSRESGAENFLLIPAVHRRLDHESRELAIDDQCD